MSQRITLYVRVRLLSDTIFGAGFSVPGGEDIAVCEDSVTWSKATQARPLRKAALYLPSLMELSVFSTSAMRLAQA